MSRSFNRVFPDTKSHERLVMIKDINDHNFDRTVECADVPVLVEGPLALAKLPPGAYRISATANGREQTRDATVARTGQRSLNFYW